MADSIEYPPGTPSWVDLSSPDLDASARFYGELFGWDVTEAGSAEETGRYRLFLLDGKQVGGLGPLQGDAPPHWNTYIATADVEETVRRAEGAGGQTVLAPMDVLDAGRMAVLSDPAGGALFALWQPGRNRGAEVVNQVGAYAWAELDTRDTDAAERFYGEVFGWTAEPIEMEGEVVYVTWKLGDRTIGGMLPMGENFPPEVPPNWVAYFGVEDLEATAQSVERLEGRTMVPAQQMPQGRFAAFADPQGATFACWEGTYDPPPGR